MNFVNTTGIVINKRVINDFDWLVTILSENLGKITVLAKGVHRPRSQRGQTLQLGNLIAISIYQRQDQYYLSESQTKLSYFNQTSGLAQTKILFYFLEILNLIVAEQQYTPLLFSYCLKGLKSIYHSKFANFVACQIKILNLLGFGPPNNIITTYQKKHYLSCQNQLQNYIQTLVGKTLISPTLF